MIDLFRYIYQVYRQQFFIKPIVKNNKNREITRDNTILVVCHPRGGSNWLGEILMQIPYTALIDEPFWRGFYRSVGELPKKKEGKIKGLSRIGFYFDQHIPIHAPWPEAKTMIQPILQGAVSDYDLWDKNKVNEIRNAATFLVKLCYGHLLLPWLHQNFSLKSIVMHRHPCAVVASQLQFVAFSKIDNNPAGKIPSFHYNDIYKKYQSVFNQIETREEYLAAVWGIKTKHVLEYQPENPDSIIIYYEHLLMHFQETLKKIGYFLNTDDIHLRKNLHKKASTSIPSKNHLLEGYQQLGKWRNHLNKSQIERILNIVYMFDIDLYGSELMPKV